MYLETFPFGCRGGNHETNILSAVSAKALIPAGGPGTKMNDKQVTINSKSIYIRRIKK